MDVFKSHSRCRRGPWARGDRGATAAEYALMVGLIAVVIVVAVMAFGSSVKGLFELVVTTAPFN